MPVLYLSEDDVKRVLTVEMALEAVETGLRKMGLEEAFNNPRSRCQTDHTTLHVLPAAAKTLGVIGFKAYTTTRTGTLFHVTLYDAKSGEMTALMRADWLGQMRTGAASAVASKYLARTDAATVGLYGTGRQARTQLLALSKIRPLKKAMVWSPKEESRNRFATQLSAECGIPVEPVADARAAADNDILITATSAREPFLKGEWLSPGQHLNVVGSNFLSKAEVDVEVIRRANLICIDSQDQGKLEAGDFVAALDQRIIEWYDIQEIARIVAHRAPGRTEPEQITLFKSLGIGLEDIAVGTRVLAAAREMGVGKLLDL